MVDKMKLAAMVREIGEVAPRVGKEYREQQAAFRDQHLAEVKLLASLVRMSKSGLPAITRRIRSSDVDGVLVFDGKDQNSRPVRLYLREDGTFWKTEEYFEDAVAEWCETGGEMAIDDVVQEFDIPGVVAILHGLLTKQAGKRKPSTDEARDTANKISAILTLLDAPPPKSVQPDDPGPPPGFDDAGPVGEDIPF